MSYVRMVMVMARLVGRHWCAPWRSPLLRWRMETYGCADAQGRLLTAADLTPARFWHFCWAQRRTLCRFLRWAATLPGLA